MGKAYVNQHIVPRRYLDRFATISNGNSIIGTRLSTQDGAKLFRKATSDVGYIRNIYDVTDKDDPKYWEHFFANEIDTLCGSELGNIIVAATLSQNKGGVLDKHGKEVLSKIIVAQIMRVPSSIEHIRRIYPETENEIKERILSTLPKDLKKKYEQKVRDFKLDEQSQKEIYLNYTFAPENFDRYCSYLQDQIWILYVNTERRTMPFVTSDNPVLVEGIGNPEVGLFQNGLANPTTCIFYPLSPSIAVAIYSKHGLLKAIQELGNSKVLLDEMDFIIGQNIKIIEQAHNHSFIPQPLFEEIDKALNNGE